MNEFDFENLYCGEDAFELAVDFHDDHDFYPVLFAGYVDDNCDAIFYVTRGSADYRFDCYTVGIETIEQCSTERDAVKYGEPLYEFIYADDLDAIVEELRLQ